MILLNIFPKNIFLVFDHFSFSIFCPWSADKLWLLMSNIEMPSKSKGGPKRSYLLKTFSCRALVASKSIFGFLPKNGHFSISKLLWKAPLITISWDRLSGWSAKACIALCEFWDLTVLPWLNFGGPLWFFLRGPRRKTIYRKLKIFGDHQPQESHHFQLPRASIQWITKILLIH